LTAFVRANPGAPGPCNKALGQSVATAYQVWNNAPEKLLGTTQDWHAKNFCAHLRLRLALMRAAQWLDQAENRSDAAHMLSDKEYLDISETELLPSLTGQMRFSRNEEPTQINCFHLFSRRCTGFSWRSDAQKNTAPGRVANRAQTGNGSKTDISSGVLSTGPLPRSSTRARHAKSRPGQQGDEQAQSALDHQ